MGTKKNKEFRVFFSWQSDSPRKTNANAIRSALKSAVKALKSVYTELTIVIDEATRDTSGSPNIATKILKKIDQADMLVCDITTINPGAERRCPNPNVTYELGFAMALLGEERIVMLFNEAHGSFPGDLPFDFVQNRASPYTLAEPVSPKSQAQLAELMKVAIRAVIDRNPKTPIQLRGLSPEKIEHAHDVDNMKWLMSKVSIPTIDEHIAGLPKYIESKVLWFWEDFNAVALSSRFSLYDKVLDEGVKRFRRAWETTLNYDQHYHDSPDGRVHIFTNPGDGLLSSTKQKAWNVIQDARDEMVVALAEILNRLRVDYKEVKVDRLSDRAWTRYVKEQREINESFAMSKKRSKSSKVADKKVKKKS
ncbi:CD-NTase-associated protein 12/Pycsar effector protein TIR domain-containing protein [Burkholderia cepacia]|uniref:TIR domain-containing protein n=1 Tax=Burkholderia cepacia TaxID=292 RepID=UPI0039A636FD